MALLSLLTDLFALPTGLSGTVPHFSQTFQMMPELREKKALPIKTLQQKVLEIAFLYCQPTLPKQRIKTVHTMPAMFVPRPHRINRASAPLH